MPSEMRAAIVAIHRSMESLGFRGRPRNRPCSFRLFAAATLMRLAAVLPLGRGTQTQLFHATQMQCTADLAPVMCWHT